MIAAIALALCGCSGGNGIEVEGINEKANGRFAYERISSDPNGLWSFGYVIDTETGVTYLVYKDGFGKNATGGITPLLNRDGTPTIDERYAK